MEKISKHISYKEGIFSATAIRKGIDNIPTDYEVNNMQVLAERVFEPLRAWVGKPIAVNSFFRSVELNKAIGGSSKSQHCEGRAIDIDDTLGGTTNADMYFYIRENLDFDQLIWEFGDDNNPDWVHVSYVSPERNRNRRLRAERIDGKTTYREI